LNDLRALQEEVTALLLGNPATAEVPYASYRRQVIESAQEEAQAAWRVRVAGKVGLACHVLMPSLRVATPEVPGPQYRFSLIVRTYHDPRVNNHDLGAEDVAMLNLAWLDGHIFDGTTQLHAEDRWEAIRAVYDFPGLLVYDAALAGELPQGYAGRTEGVTMSTDGAGWVELGCAESGAAIFYTVDGSTPLRPANAGEATTAALYAGPFQVADGTLVRCLALAAGKLPSQESRATIKMI
jgi:hypothetical protein